MSEITLKLDVDEFEDLIADRLKFAEEMGWVDSNTFNLWLDALVEFVWSVGEIKGSINSYVDNLIVNDCFVVTKEEFEWSVENFKEDFTDEDAEYENDIKNTCDIALKKINKGDLLCDEVKELLNLGLTIDGATNFENIMYQSEDGIIVWAY